MATPFLFPEDEIKTDYTPRPNLHFSCREDLEKYRIEKVKALRSRTDMSWKEKYAAYVQGKHWHSLRVRKLELVKECQRCKSTQYLHVHHVNYKSWYDCTFDDLEVLCEGCHNSQHYKKKANGIGDACGEAAVSG